MFFMGRNREIVKQGFGPFSPKTLKAWLNAECQKCERRINQNALYGSALVVNNTGIEVTCRECRGGPQAPVDIYQSYKNMRGSESLPFLAKRNCTKTQIKLDWFEVLCILRTETVLLSIGEIKHAFVHDSDRNSLYNVLPGPKYCPECGAVWVKEDKKWNFNGKNPWNSEICWHCQMPHELQWHMRITEGEERNLLHPFH